MDTATASAIESIPNLTDLTNTFAARLAEIARQIRRTLQSLDGTLSVLDEYGDRVSDMARWLLESNAAHLEERLIALELEQERELRRYEEALSEMKLPAVSADTELSNSASAEGSPLRRAAVWNVGDSPQGV